MEIWTLVKAGIRNRKGIMLGFMLLTMLIVISVITMLGVRKNYDAAIKKAFEIEDKGVVYEHFKNGSLSDELIKKVEADETVDHLEINDSLVGINITIDDKEDGNSYFMKKMPETVPIFNEDVTELIMPGTPDYKARALKKGEIYIPYGLKNRLDAKVGAKLKAEFISGEREFTVKGFVQECYMGSSIVGYKQVFISDEDFDDIYAACKDSIHDPETDSWAIGKDVYIFPSDKADESSAIFLRNLNLSTGIDDMATASLTREAAEHYTGLFIMIILAVITGFAILLFAIFLIVAGHNISTEMEIEYTNLGILKSQGFTDRMIRFVYIIQYLLVELVGIILGVVISVPSERWMSRIFFKLTAILPEKNLPVVESILFAVVLFVVTFIYIYVFTRKVSKTTPVKAITNGRDDFYFDSRMNAPIGKKCLGFWLGLRQITSAPKRYISTVVVTALLLFTIITVELMSGFIQSRTALAAMGEPFFDLEFARTNLEADIKNSDIEKIVNKYTEIEDRVSKSHIYLSVNGESLCCIVKAYPENLSSVYKGREVKYDNEVVITEQVSKLLNLNIGDNVTIGRNKYNGEYVVVGIFQTMNDTGKAISMSLAGLDRLKDPGEEAYTVEQLNMHGLVLKDTSRGKEIEKEIKDTYGDDIEVKYQDYDDENALFVDEFYTAANGSKLLIYVLSIAFALVTVVMVCSKAFIQERTDLGIMRATGFSVRRVRRQFALRFMIISLVSSVFGVILSRLYSDDLMEAIFSLFGIPHVELEYGLMFFIKPIVIFSICYLVLGYIASRKVKKLSSRELITE